MDFYQSRIRFKNFPYFSAVNSMIHFYASDQDHFLDDCYILCAETNSPVFAAISFKATDKKNVFEF